MTPAESIIQLTNEFLTSLGDLPLADGEEQKVRRDFEEYHGKHRVQ
jgi:hypothetical protein